MATNIVNVDPYLRTSWHFTQDAQLMTELTRSFNEVAIVTNMRVIGTFALNLLAITGEQWFLGGSNRQQQSLRMLFQFSDSNLIFNHNLNLASFGNVVKIYGTFFDGTSWNTLPYVDVTSATNQINVRITNTQVVITKGGGAPPAVSNGLLVIEFLSQA